MQILPRVKNTLDPAYVHKVKNIINEILCSRVCVLSGLEKIGWKCSLRLFRSSFSNVRNDISGITRDKSIVTETASHGEIKFGLICSYFSCILIDETISRISRSRKYRLTTHPKHTTVRTTATEHNLADDKTDG